MSLATLSGRSGSIQLPVVATTYGLNSQIQSAQLHQGVVYYPIKVLQDDFNFTVQFRSVQAYRQAQDFIQATNKSLVSSAASGSAVQGYFMHFAWPEMGIDYQGFIAQSPMGGKKFDFAPKISYTMILVQDSIYNAVNFASNAPNFANIYGTNTQNPNAVITGPEDRVIPPPAPAPAPAAPVAPPAPGPAPVAPPPTTSGGRAGGPGGAAR